MNQYSVFIQMINEWIIEYFSMHSESQTCGSIGRVPFVSDWHCKPVPDVSEWDCKPILNVNDSTESLIQMAMYGMITLFLIRTIYICKLVSDASEWDCRAVSDVNELQCNAISDRTIRDLEPSSAVLCYDL